jgi:biofilm PGA synthesis protein PgaA
LVTLGLVVATSAWSQVPVGSHQQAVELARRGDYAESLALFDELCQREPENLPILYDYLVTQSWAGNDAQVAALFKRVAPDQAPRYVLEAAAKSLRNLKSFDQAEAVYRIGIQRFNAYPSLRLGLLYTLVDAGQHQAAATFSEELEALYPGNIEVQFAIAYAAEGRRDYVAALQHYQRILQWQPELKRARHLEILTLAAIGEPFLAEERAVRYPGLLTADEMHRLKAAQAALVVRWGSHGSDTPELRFAETDRALGMLESNLQAALADQPPAEKYALQARIDRLVALRDRVWMAQVVDEYEALRSEQVSLPGYALQAVADAFLYLEQPRQAGDLYQQVLQRDPQNYEASQGLFFAYVEQEDFERALALAETLCASQAKASHGGDDPSRFDTELLATMGQWFAGDLAGAQSRLTPMYNRAPANIDIIGELGGLYGARGWPRRAEETLGLGLALDPAYLSLRTGWAENRLDLAEFSQAEQLIDTLGEEYPEHKSVQRLQRLWQAHNMRELQVSVASGWSSGSTFGSHDLSLAATLFSAPVGYRYRGFVSTYLDQATFPEGDKTLQRYGAGIEYRHRKLYGTAELTWNASGGEKIGTRLAATWFPDDVWSVPVELEVFSRDTPLRALKHGIHADAAGVGVAYRRDELQRWYTNVQFMDFSDDNFRYSVLAGVEQGLIVWPHYRLNGHLDLYTSGNSLTDTPYFNPRQDADLTLTLENDWLLYRHYRFSFRNRLAVSVGGYWQQDFGTEPTAAVRYEHVWEYSPRFFLLYGVSFARRTYDGDGENQLGCHLELNWRF